MSTSLSQLDPSTWKQEVNRRVAAHKKSKPAAAPPQAEHEARPMPGSRAAKAAARVAERFAHAPSYNEMLAQEARVAAQAAETAARAAMEAQARVQLILDGMGAVSAPESARETQPAADAPVQPDHTPEMQHADEPSAAEHFEIRWERELPARQTVSRVTRGPELFEVEAEEWAQEPFAAQPQEIAVVEPAQPIYGNLIEFPRELVATRKVRPRLAEGPLAGAADSAQLSIFEVDPGAISLEPEVESPARQASAQAWTGPEWSGIKLDAEPVEDLLEEPAPQPQPAPAVELASMSRQLLAMVVDGALVAGAFLTAAALAANNATELPGPRTVEMGSILALLVAAAAYKVLFFTLARATPGMKYARIRLCTFEGFAPTRAQRYARLTALLLSILPVGLGFAWAIFDDQHLAWHDRLSRTYMRLN